MQALSTKMESVVEKVVEKVVHKCMKTQGSASKDEIQRSIQASLKGRIEEYLKTMAPQKTHIDKKDLAIPFAHNLATRLKANPKQTVEDMKKAAE